MNTYLSTRFFTYVKCYMIISGIPSFALSFVNSFPWFQVATNVMILVLSSEYTTMGPNTFEIELHIKFNKLKLSKKNFNRGDTVSITAGIRSRELCQAPISARVIFSLEGVVGESLSFSTLQMQRRLHPDSNARLATYCHSRH